MPIFNLLQLQRFKSVNVYIPAANKVNGFCVWFLFSLYKRSEDRRVGQYGFPWPLKELPG